MNAQLQRTAFETSRELEYFTEKELRAQIGYAPPFWPVAILRELIDNALDACENTDRPPVITVTVADDAITVQDNGDGIPAAVLLKSLDYSLRVSDKAHYVAPTRGAMGNALKVLWAAPFVATGSCRVEVLSQGKRHEIAVTLDRIAQKPAITHTELARQVGADPNGHFLQDGKNGTRITVWWPESTRQLTEPGNDQFLQVPTARELIAGYAAFNPHATFSLNDAKFPCSAPAWRKWRTNSPTSAHWYTKETLRDLIAAYVAAERTGAPARTVRAFVAEFRGLSSTAKQKAVTGAWARSYLHDFTAEGDIDPAFVTTLLDRMRGASTAPKPTALGIIGKDHVAQWLGTHGVRADAVRYQRASGTDEGMPYVVEVGFGPNTDEQSNRRIITGLNWSPVIGSTPDAGLREAISAARLDADDPVTLLVHIARARFDFADRGKTRLA